MNTKTTLAALALLIGSALSSTSFAQSGTITFTGSILAPACTGSGNTNANRDNVVVSLDQCASSQAQVVRTSIRNDSLNTTTTTQRDDNSALVTVTCE